MISPVENSATPGATGARSAPFRPLRRPNIWPGDFILEAVRSSASQRRRHGDVGKGQAAWKRVRWRAGGEGGGKWGLGEFRMREEGWVWV
jgi:hypothetical protein